MTTRLRTALSVLVISLLALTCQQAPKTTENDSTKTRILEAGAIRAAYVVYPPILSRDPNSGTMTGISVDILKEVARRLGVKLVWGEEVGWATMVEGLKAGKYDIVGTAVWPTAQRGKVADFSVPLFYSVLQAYGRTGPSVRTRLVDLDSPSVRLSTIDGEISDIVARQRFPRAQRLSLPQASQPSLALLNVAAGKADVAFIEPVVAMAYQDANPGGIQVLFDGEPVLYSPNSFMFLAGNPSLKSMIDTALLELQNSGFITGVLAKHDPRHTFFETSLPFRQ